MKLTGKMIGYFLVVILVATIGFGCIFYDSAGTKKDVIDVKDEDIARLMMAVEITQNSLIQAASARGFLLTGNENIYQEYQKAFTDNAKLEQKLIALARDEQTKKLIKEVMDLEQKYAGVLERKIFPLVRQGRVAEAVAGLGEAMQYAEKMMEAVASLKQSLVVKTNASLANAVASAGNTITISLAAAILSFILGIGIAVYSARGIAGQVGRLAGLVKEVAAGDLTDTYRGRIGKDEIGELAVSVNTMVGNLRQMVATIGSQSQNLAASSEELTASADQSAKASQLVAGSVNAVAGGTSKQLASVKDAIGVVENMMAELEEVSSNISLIADKAAQTSDMASGGGASANKAISQMQEVEKTVSESARVVAQLGERSKEIGQIVDTISGLAAQTNLLALNAAIEAARAGEQGRGFAVVAEEVRKLAEQSQEASKRIAGLIGEIQTETDRAVSAMDSGTREVKLGAQVVNETGESFQNIIGLVTQASIQIGSIAKVVRSVAQSSEKIVSSVHYINELSKSAADEIETVSAATEEQSASTQEIAAASQNLSRLAQDMQATVDRFRV